ncbi:MAG: cytochrome c biogenesis protein CcdA [Spirochaetales bacterium]|nr:cytochrome c biogenesis protein CcdA [Spirochaetales bacterium]
MTDVSFAVAIGAGLLSFLSPCVLPLIPGYLSFISGAGADEIRSGSKRSGVFYRTLFFVLGFSTIFVALGVLFSGGGMIVAGASNRILSIVAGSIVIVLGLNMIFDFLRFLNAEAKAHVTSKPTNAAGAFVVGMAFGAGWTPCIGPILASILFMAARAGGAAQAALLLTAYSAGLALPFLAAGLFFERLSPLWAWFKKHGNVVRIASGVLLILIGLSMALGKLTALNAGAARLGIRMKGLIAANPEQAQAWTIVVLVALLLAIALPPLIRRRRFAKPGRLVVLAIVVVVLVLEALGVVSVLGIVSDWLLFQGA